MSFGRAVKLKASTSSSKSGDQLCQFDETRHLGSEILAKIQSEQRSLLEVCTETTN